MEQTETPRRLVSPPIGRDLTERQKLACAFRILAREGWTQNLAGHITYVIDDAGNMLVNPWGKWWQEVRASDLCVVSPDGRMIDGEHDVTPAIFIHTELHAQRGDARVIVHNHPFFATVLAGLGIAPVLTEQTGAMFAEDIAMYNEFTGGIDNAEAGKQLAVAVGDARAALLVNHGALVTGQSVEEATYRAVSFERVCKIAYHTLLTGRDPVPIEPEIAGVMQEAFFAPETVECFWNGAVRLLLRQEPDVLD